MKRLFLLVITALAGIYGAEAQTALDGASWGALAISANGDTLLNVRSGDRFVPASNTKLITAGAGLIALGKDFRWDTNLAYSGSIEDGVLNGDIYIIGGGDPTTGASGNADAVFAEWKDLILAKGIYKINGNIIGDGRFFDGEAEDTSWEYEDLGFYYGKGPEALNYYKNTQDLIAQAGAEVGSPVLITASTPQLPWMEFRHHSTTGKSGSGDKLYYYNTDLAPLGSMRGTLGIDIKRKMEQTSNRFPVYTCAYFFHKYLQGNGISISGCYADVDPDGNIRTDLSAGSGSKQKAAEWEQMKNIGSAYSMQLNQVIKEMMLTSDNFYAEAVFRMIGLNLKGHTDFASSIEAVETIVEDLGLDTGGLRLRDGNGLSRANYISPEFLVSFLQAMKESPAFEDFYSALPQPGLGTLASNLANSSRELRNRVRMKSGSMDGVRCYSGYICPADGDTAKATVFSIMVNNATAPSRDLIKAIDNIILDLAGR